jgi:hypothetical protein
LCVFFSYFEASAISHLAASRGIKDLFAIVKTSLFINDMAKFYQKG